MYLQKDYHGGITYAKKKALYRKTEARGNEFNQKITKVIWRLPVLRFPISYLVEIRLVKR